LAQVVFLYTSHRHTPCVGYSILCLHLQYTLFEAMSAADISGGNGGTSSGDSTLHVTGLPAGTTEEQVTAIFAQFGAVKAAKVLPARDDKPDAAAIIDMETAEQAQNLCDNVNGTTPAGLSAPLVIKKKTQSWGKGWGKGYNYQMMSYKGKGWGKGGGWGGGLRSFDAEKKIWIGGIPEEGVDFKELQAHFPGSKFATVMKGKGAGTGGVAFGTAEEATAAIATLNGSTLGGATIVVDVWTKKEDEPAAETAAA